MQFTVYRNANKSAVYPYLLDVQSDIMGSIWETVRILVKMNGYSGGT